MRIQGDVYKVMIPYTRAHAMRTNIDIDDDLMREAMRASGAPTKRAAVEQGLRMLIAVSAAPGV